MHFIKSLSALLLVATAAIASPIIGNPIPHIKHNDGGDGGAGAFINNPKDVKFTSVAGTVTMPDISKAKEKEIVSYWVGMDGINTGRVIQAGFDATKGAGSSATYQAFYEWYPNPAKFIATSDFAVHKGDVVSVTVTTTRFGTTAKATFNNKNTGKTYTTPEFHSPGEEYDATGIYAQWIVEEPPQRALANFGEIVFTHCYAADEHNKQYNLKGGHAVRLVKQGKTIAEGSIKNDNEVHVKYTA